MGKIVHILKQKYGLVTSIGMLPNKIFSCFGRLAVALCLLVLSVSASAQVIALKNNLLYDATASANLAFEVKLADRWTLGAGAGLNLWNPVHSADRDKDQPPKWRHVLVNLEARYWFCSVFVRDFIGMNVVYSHYNVAGSVNGSGYPVSWIYKDLENNRRQGDMVAAGVFYGWSWILSPHISLELEGGADVGYTWYDEFDCARCGALHEPKQQWFVMPKVGINFIWQIK